MATHPLVSAANKAVLALGPELDRLQGEVVTANDRTAAAVDAQRAAEAKAAGLQQQLDAANARLTQLQHERADLDREAAQLRDYFARLDTIGAVFAPVDVPTLEPRKPILEQLADAVKAGTL